jgi:hypothetical protein
LQDISEADAQAEGVLKEDLLFNPWMNYEKAIYQMETARESFESLWHEIDGPSRWETNPWLWVEEFKRLS